MDDLAKRKARIRGSSVGAAILIAVLSGCSSIGPGTITRDRSDYLGAIGDSWKQQTLLNIVRLRYGDAPVFLDVSSVISSYALQGQVSANGVMSLDDPGSVVGLGANATYVDKPTISYTPLIGDRFAKSLLTPIPPAAIFSLIQAGYPSDFVLWATVRALNGIYNRSSAGARGRPADPRFYPLLQALRRIQVSGVLGTRLEKRGPEEHALLLIPGSPSPEQQRDVDFVVDTLKLKPKNGEIELAFGATQRSENELAVLSRSMLEILLEVSAGIEVPAEHVAEGRTQTGVVAAPGAPPLDQPIVHIYSGASRPEGAYAVTQYRGTWYWIDDHDLMGKRAFTFLLMFFSLAETGVAPQAPVLTIPAN